MRKELSETLLRGSMAALIVFATIMLGVGEESVVLTLTTLVAVAVSTYITDIRKSFHLTQTIADCAALGVVVISAANMMYIDRAGQIGAVASLQSYLQYVLLFQPKTPRVYWQLGLLSLGQVAIAATLVPGPLFGAMLSAYLLIGFFAFTLLILRSEASRYASPPPPARPTLALAPAGVARTPGSRAPRLRGSVATVSGGLRWGLLEPIATMCLVTFVVTTLLFFFIPRRDVDKRQVPTNEPLRSVGFSTTITLGELGEVVQNPDVVMRIEFFRGRSTQPLRLADELLLRGSVVTRYENGAWTQPHLASIVALPRKFTLPYVRQRITIEPMDIPELFCVNPVFALHPDRRLQLNGSTGQLIRQEDYRSERMVFEVGTTGIRNNRMRRFLPLGYPLNDFSQKRLIEMPVASDGESDAFSGLRETAARVLRESGVDPRNRVATARVLHDYLRFSGKYTYSLEWQPRDRNLDPLEDFVTLHPAGHCEYFAGALVMMFRSQGIPARLAIGFKGGEWNSLGMYYQVQQLHAHTWVEVYLGKEDIPPDAFDDDESPAAAWYILDPTVSIADGGGDDQRTSLLARLRHSIDYARVLWSKYIVGLNSERQQRGIYEPIWAGAQAGFQNLFGPEIWSQRLRAVANSRVGTFWEWYRRHWFSWRGGLVAIGASLVLATCYFGLHWAAAALRRWGVPLGRQRPQEPPTLEMYRRLEAALARRGFRRASAQTAREFAMVAGGHLAESIELNRVSHLPRRIVESFYRVRFGGRTLDNREVKAVEHALGDLERALARHR